MSTKCLNKSGKPNPIAVKTNATLAAMASDGPTIIGKMTARCRRGAGKSLNSVRRRTPHKTSNGKNEATPKYQWGSSLKSSDPNFVHPAPINQGFNPLILPKTAPATAAASAATKQPVQSRAFQLTPGD